MEKVSYFLLDEKTQGLESAQKQALCIVDKLEQFRGEIVANETSKCWREILAGARKKVESGSIISDQAFLSGASKTATPTNSDCKELVLMRVQNLLLGEYSNQAEKKGLEIDHILLSKEYSLKEKMEKIKKIQNFLNTLRGELSVFLLMAKAQQEKINPA